jgi:hypothetical protein
VNKPRAITVLFGLMVAAIIPAFAFTLTLTAPTNPTAMAPIFLTGYAYSILVATVFGVPFYLLGRRLKIWTYWSSAVVGFVIGLVIAALLPVPTSPLSLAVEIYIAMGFVGMVSGSVFWTIVRS